MKFAEMNDASASSIFVAGAPGAAGVVGVTDRGAVEAGRVVRVIGIAIFLVFFFSSRGRRP